MNNKSRNNVKKNWNRKRDDYFDSNTYDNDIVSNTGPSHDFRSRYHNYTSFSNLPNQPTGFSDDYFDSYTNDYYTVSNTGPSHNINKSTAVNNVESNWDWSDSTDNNRVPNTDSSHLNSSTAENNEFTNNINNYSCNRAGNYCSDQNIGNNFNSFNPNCGPSWLSNDLSNKDEISDSDLNSDQSVDFKQKTTLPKNMDDKNRRIVSKESLFQEPKFFENDTDVTPVITDPVNNTKTDSEKDIAIQNSDAQYDFGFDWSKTNWQKANKTLPSTTQVHQKPNARIPPRNKKLAQTLKVALSKPVTMSKAESMMQKMGWQGGALGKTGDGILEPIKPDVTYGSRSGFGQEQKPSRKMLKESRQRCLKLKCKADIERLKTNILIQILEFVRNDYEVEIVFDRRLNGKQRKYIHCMVNDIINDSGEIHDMELDNLMQMDILTTIQKENIYHLATESEGKRQNRHLCLFKEAPDYMYLVIPADLRDEIEDAEANKSNDGKDPVESEVIEVESEDDGMDEKTDIQKTKSKKNSKRKSEITSTDEVLHKFEEHCRIITENSVNPNTLRTIVEYFIEFIESDDYTQFRFLGTFSPDEIGPINYFLRNYSDLVKFLDDKKNTLDDFKRNGNCLQCTEDKNGSIVFFKLTHQDLVE